MQQRIDKKLIYFGRNVPGASGGKETDVLNIIIQKHYKDSSVV